MAFAATGATAAASLCRLFNKDKVYGNISSLLVGLGVGILISAVYFFLDEKFSYQIIFLQKDRVGNFLTVISMILCFIGYIRDMLDSIISEIRSND